MSGCRKCGTYIVELFLAFKSILMWASPLKAVKVLFPGWTGKRKNSFHLHGKFYHLHSTHELCGGYAQNERDSERQIQHHLICGINYEFNAY